MKIVSRNKVKGVEIDGEFVSIEDLAAAYNGQPATGDLSCRELIDLAQKNVEAAYKVAREDEDNPRVLDIDFAMSGLDRMRGGL